MKYTSNPQRPAKRKVVWPVILVAVGIVGIIGRNIDRAVSNGSQDKLIIGNLRQIRAGADRYFVLHPGVTSVASTTIVGTNSSDYVKLFATVAQESYTPIILPERALSLIHI